MDFITQRFENLVTTNRVKAVDLIKEAIKNEPNNAEYLTSYGKYLCENDYTAEGVKLLMKADKIKSLDLPVKFTLANSLLKLGEYAEAIIYFKHLKKDYPEASYNSAICYIRINKLDEAIKELRSLRNSKSLAQEAQKLLISILNFRFDHEELYKELEYYKSAFGEDEYYHLESGKEAVVNHRDFEAIKHFQKLKNSDIDKDSYYSLFVISLNRLENYELSLEILKYLWKAKPEDYHLTYDFAQCLINCKKYSQALDVIDYYVEDNEESSEMKYLRVKAENLLKLTNP